jgi:hypothetical protein
MLSKEEKILCYQGFLGGKKEACERDRKKKRICVNLWIFLLFLMLISKEIIVANKRVSLLFTFVPFKKLNSI